MESVDATKIQATPLAGPRACHGTHEAGRERERTGARARGGSDYVVRMEAQVGRTAEAPPERAGARYARRAHRRAGRPSRTAGGSGRAAMDGAGFFRQCLAQGPGEGAAERQRWRAGLYAEIRERMRAQGGLSIRRM